MIEFRTTICSPNEVRNVDDMRPIVWTTIGNCALERCTLSSMITRSPISYGAVKSTNEAPATRDDTVDPIANERASSRVASVTSALVTSISHIINTQSPITPTLMPWATRCTRLFTAPYEVMVAERNCCSATTRDIADRKSVSRMAVMVGGNSRSNASNCAWIFVCRSVELFGSVVDGVEALSVELELFAAALPRLLATTSARSCALGTAFGRPFRPVGVPPTGRLLWVSSSSLPASDRRTLKSLRPFSPRAPRLEAMEPKSPPRLSELLS
mmetsp:Transcript_19775/g.41576  ORF Transcript_19775/g.41576 Transcript_19775/m.41576 type:complete len:271 (+) Transcript_19775:1143-1955(+)